MNIVDSHELGDYAALRTEDTYGNLVATFVGNLKSLCPSLYFSLSTWERDHLDSTFMPKRLPSSVNDSGTSSETDMMRTDPVVDRDDPLPKSVITLEPLSAELFPKTFIDDRCTVLGTNRVVCIDPVLDRMITSLVPPFREYSSPIPLLTFLGKGFFNVSKLNGAIGVSSNCGETAVKSLAWSRGLRLEVSPIKTRSACKKSGTNLSFSAQHLETHLE